MGSTCKMANKILRSFLTKKLRATFGSILGKKYDAKLKKIVDRIAVCNLCKVIVKNEGELQT